MVPINKQYLTLRGKLILSYILDVLSCSLIDEIILVINKNEFKICRRFKSSQLFQNQPSGCL